MNIPASPKPIEPTEAQITKAVMDAWRKLGLPNTLVASIPNMGARGQYGLTKGLPDLLVVASGLPVAFLELKTSRGKLSAAQVGFAAVCQVNGVIHRVTYSLDEALQTLANWRVIRKIERAA